MNGSIAPGTMPVNGLISYQLAGTLGQGIALSLTASYSAYIVLYKPDGSYVTYGTNSLTISSLPVTGTYTVVIQGTSYGYTGSYNLMTTGVLSSAAAADGAYCLECNKGGAAAGDPINVATGNLYESVTDYATVGTNPLALTRFYNSMSVSRSLYATLTGVNWRTNYDLYLQIASGTAVAAQRANGQVVNFYLVGGVWGPDADMDYTLTNSGATWTLTDSDDTVETYTASGSNATLNTIKLRNGYTQTLHYTSGVLTSVSDSYGRTFNFTYTGGVLTGVTTPDSLTLTYGYTTVSSNKLLTSVTYNTSPATSLTYLYENASFPYALTGITDENGNRYATWTYDGTGRALSSELAGGVSKTQITYSSSGNYTVTGPLGIAETYSFTTLQNVPKATRIDRAANGSVAAASRFMTYDTNGYLNSQTDWNGNQTAYVNNSHGDPTTIVYASGSAVSHTTTIAYDSTWPHLPKTITEPDRITTLTYDSSGNVLTRSIKDTASQSVPYFTSGTVRNWTYTWSGTGQLLTAQLPRTDVTAKTTLTYSSGALKTITDALSHVTTINTYQPGGLPLTITDPNSVLTTLSYNPRNWLTSSVLSLASGGTLTTSMQYDSAGNLTRYTWPDASYLAYTYDNAHRLTGIANALSETKTLTLDSAGNITAQVWKNATPATTWQHSATYDGLSRLSTDIGGMGQTTSYAYDSNGNVLSVTDPLSSVTTLQYDSLNRVIKNTDPLTNLTQYTYNAHDAVLSVTDPRAKVTNYTYDGFGEMIQEASPDRGTSVLKFDSDGNVTQQTDANGYVTNMTYDALDRILTRTYPADSSLNVAFTYDQTGHGKGIGMLTSGTDQTGSFSRSYEERGLMTANNRTMTGGNAYNTAFSYQSAGRVSTITYASSGWMVAYARDAAGQITAVTDKPPSLTAVNIATSVTHLPFGPVKSMTWGNGVTDARTFDLDYRMTSVKDVGTGNVQYSSYGYNANNSITSILDNVTPANNQTLQYNSADWLKFASGSYGTGITMSYDSSGNRTAYGATSYAIASTSNRLSTTAGSAVTYTSSGNITGIASGPSFTYNKANQMATAVVSGTTSTYGYDAFGQRLKAQVGTTPVRILTYYNSGVLTESSTGTKTDYIYLDGFPVGVVQPAASTVSYIHTDYLGTPQKATNASKTVVWSGAYNPNGLVTPTTSINMNLRYAGQIQDVTGFYHNGYRDYNPATNYGTPRYLQADPIGLAGGINPYAYVINNPFKYIDPLGLQAIAETPLGPVPLPSVVIPGTPENQKASEAMKEAIQGAMDDAVEGFKKLCGIPGSPLYPLNPIVNGQAPNSEGESREKNCQALKQSILSTCASLTGRKKFDCFAAAQESYEQCMGE